MSQLSREKTRFHRHVQLLAISLMAASLIGCGGGGDSSSPSPSGATNSPGGSGQGVTSPAGTYTVKTNGGTSGSFLLDSAGVITTCAVSQDKQCSATTQTSTEGTRFTLTGSETSATGTIAASGAVTGQLTQAGSSSVALTGSKTSSDYVDCVAPLIPGNGQCALPQDKIVIAPTIIWLVEMAGGTWSSEAGMRYNWRYSLCIGYGTCDRVIKTFLLTPDDMADEETKELMAYAESVAKDFQAMIARMWKSKTYPTLSQAQTIFKNAVDAAIAEDAPVAAERAASAFTSAGFPAAGSSSTATGTPSGSEPTVASACGNLVYTGDRSEPQAYVFDQYAQQLSCLHKTTGENQFLTNGNKVCGILDGLIKATSGTFRPLFCTGAKLKTSS